MSLCSTQQRRSKPGLQNVCFRACCISLLGALSPPTIEPLRRPDTDHLVIRMISDASFAKHGIRSFSVAAQQ